MGNGSSFLNHNRDGKSWNVACALCHCPHVVRRRPLDVSRGTTEKPQELAWQAVEVVGVLGGRQMLGDTPEAACRALALAIGTG